MQRDNDRRASGVQRVPVERIVDVCPTRTLGTTFQGWSMDVSGRGMRVRAAHVPELGAAVVVRFEEQGAEVIAEGQISWREETAGGAEFGVRFTALDNRSVQALKALCQGSALPAGALRDVFAAPVEEQHDTEPAPVAAIKLHIDGLAAPMQAHVRRQGERQLALGSPLEFLRVGREVEVEDVALGERRGARIESVDVRVDPASRVPELIVSLGYPQKPARVPRPDGSTARLPLPLPRERRDPPPSSKPALSVAAVITGEAPAKKERAPSPRPAPVTAVEAALRAGLDVPSAGTEVRARALAEDDVPPAGDDGAEDDEVSLPLDPYETKDDAPSEGPSLEIDESGGPSDLERLRQRLDGVLDNLSSAARVTSERCRQLGSTASRHAERLAERTREAGRRVMARRSALPLRRTAAAPPPSARAARATLRASGPRAERGASGARGPSPRALLGVGLMTLALLGTWWGRGSSTAESVLPAPARASTPAAPPPVSEPAPSPSPRPLAPLGEDEPAEPAESSAALAQLPASELSSSEPAPVEPSASLGAIEERPLARATSNESLFERTPPRRKASPPRPAPRKTAPRALPQFASGRLDLPIVYRLRLDEPGQSLRGERKPTGFDVVIPGRKTLESASAIARRDPRFAKVSTRNGRDGAHISFRFRSSVPGYKVRLRGEYVEIFISR